MFVRFLVSFPLFLCAGSVCTSQAWFSRNPTVLCVCDNQHINPWHPVKSYDILSQQRRWLMASTDPPHRCGIGSGEESDTRRRRLTLTSPIPGNQPAQALAHNKQTGDYFFWGLGLQEQSDLYTRIISVVLSLLKNNKSNLSSSNFMELCGVNILRQYRDVICLYQTASVHTFVWLKQL